MILKNYYLHRDGQNYGPYPEEQMRAMIASRQILPEEQICEEGGSSWVLASTLNPMQSKPVAAPVAVVRQKPAETQFAVNETHVSAAYQKLKAPALGFFFSIFVPLMLLAAKSDAERGVRTTGKHRFLKELAMKNTDLLPIATVIGVIGAVVCAIWFFKAYKFARLIKTLAKQSQS